MKVKDYRGASLRECLQQVKKEMGAEAIILASKSVRIGGILGVGGHEEFHVRASIDDESYILSKSYQTCVVHKNGRPSPAGYG